MFRFKSIAVAAAAALVASVSMVPAQAVDKEVLVWADETRGPNLTKVIEGKGDWVPGYKIVIRTFSSFDALKTAVDNATDLTGPDIIVGANDWVATGAKNGKLAPLTLSNAVKNRFTPNNLFDLSYKGNLYGVPLDINNVAMIYNTKLVKSAPKSFGDMVNYYTANKSKQKLVAGLCVAGGGMSWGAHSILSALGGNAYTLKNGKVVTSGNPVPAAFAANVKTYLLNKNGKSNGFLPASDAGCKDNFLAGKVSVSGAMLTSYAAKRGVEAGAKDVLTKFFASTEGAIRYQSVELRPPAEKGAQQADLTAAQIGFGKAGSMAGIPQIGAILNGTAGSASYWDLLPAFWTAVLTDGKDPAAEAKKLNDFFKKNIEAGVKDL